MCDRYEPSNKLALAKCKCPRCQSGKMFTHPFYNLNHFSEMHVNCPVCGLRFEIEPGFFWGAMYVSYALTVSMMLVLAGLILWLSNGEAGFWTYVIPIVSCLVGTIPITFRYSRVMMLYFFSPVRFDPNTRKQ